MIKNETRCRVDVKRRAYTARLSENPSSSPAYEVVTTDGGLDEFPIHPAVSIMAPVVHFRLPGHRTSPVHGLERNKVCILPFFGVLNMIQTSDLSNSKGIGMFLSVSIIFRR